MPLALPQIDTSTRCVPPGREKLCQITLPRCRRTWIFRGYQGLGGVSGRA